MRTSESRHFVRSGFGSNRSLPVIDFVVFGLITFWVYTVLRMARHLHVHFETRWSEFSGGLDEAKKETARREGFTAPKALLLLSAILFGFDGLLVASWFYGYIVTDILSSDYAVIMGLVGTSSAIFYIATLVAVLSVANAVKAHETVETMLRTLGGDALQADDWTPSDEMISLWEKLHGRLALFLIVALPIAFSPTFGVHIFLTKTGASIDFLMLLAVSCFVLAGIFHIWGTSILIGFLNSHLEYEAQCAGVIERTPAATPSKDRPAQPDESEDSHARRQLMTIMLTDIVGYSRSMEQDEDAAFARLVEHNQIMRASIADHRGVEIKTIGDAFLVVFDSVLDSVNCAISMQRALADYNNEKAENEKVVVRIGIHLGDVIVTENDIFGDGVNIAARIESLADPGGICISQDVYSLVKKKLAIEIEHLKDASLKNIAVAPDVYRIRLR